MFLGGNVLEKLIAHDFIGTVWDPIDSERDVEVNLSRVTFVKKNMAYRFLKPPIMVLEFYFQDRDCPEIIKYDCLSVVKNDKNFQSYDEREIKDRYFVNKTLVTSILKEKDNNHDIYYKKIIFGDNDDPCYIII